MARLEIQFELQFRTGDSRLEEIGRSPKSALISRLELSIRVLGWAENDRPAIAQRLLRQHGHVVGHSEIVGTDVCELRWSRRRQSVGRHVTGAANHVSFDIDQRSPPARQNPPQLGKTLGDQIDRFDLRNAFQKSVHLEKVLIGLTVGDLLTGELPDQSDDDGGQREQCGVFERGEQRPCADGSADHRLSRLDHDIHRTGVDALVSGPPDEGGGDSGSGGFGQRDRQRDHRQTLD